MDDDDLDRLEALLDEGMDDGPSLSELDGYLTGVVVSPDAVAAADWFPRLRDMGLPRLDDARTQATFDDLLLRHHADLAARLAEPGAFAPIISVDPRQGDELWEIWIDGFAAAMRLSPHGWNRLRVTPDAAAASAFAELSRLILFVDDAEDFTREEEDALHRDAPAMIAGWVQTLHDWRTDPRRSAAPVKAGRNDPCPCGSGRKFKKCCGG